jgi:serine/threonine-protein kinase
MPRQQVLDFKHAGPEVDVWAAAASLYKLLTGDYPRDFPDDEDPWRIVLNKNAVPIRSRRPEIPANLAQVIDTALTDNPKIIFQKAGALKEALIEAAKSDGVELSAGGEFVK